MSSSAADPPKRNASARWPARLRSGEFWLLAALVAVLTVLTVLPMGRLLLEAVAPSGEAGLGTVAKVMSDPRTWRATVHTLEVGLGGAALATIIGTVMALLAGLTDIRLKTPMVFCFMLPLMIPAQVSAISWIELMGAQSPILRILGLSPSPGDLNPMYSREGIILLLGLQAAPMVFVAVRAGLRALPREMVEAAQSSGAARLRVLHQVVLPLMTPSLVAGGALAFVSSIGNFGIPALLGIPGRYTVLSVLIYKKLFDFGPTVLGETAAIAMILAALALVGIALQGWILRRRDYRVIGAAAVLLPYRLGRWRVPVEITCWLLVTVMLVLPLTALVLSSLTPAYGIPLTFDNMVWSHYRYVLFEDSTTLQAITNSLSLSGGAAVLLVLLATPFAYFLVWKPNWLMRLLNFCAELPYSVPGTVVAIACILVFLRPIPLIGVTIYGTVWIIFAAYLIRFLNRGLRPIVSGFLQLDRTLEEAAAMSGAGLTRRMRTVILPLVGPAAMASVLIVFLAAFNELTVSALLWAAGSETVGVMIFNLKDAGDSLEAAAMAVLTVVITVVLMLALSALRPFLPMGVIPWRD